MVTIKEVLLPSIGDFKDVDVIEVLVSPGDFVRPDDSLITLESEKATMEIPSPYAGTVRDVHVKVGDKVSEGSPVLRLEVTEEEQSAPAKPALQEPARETSAAAADAPPVEATPEAESIQPSEPGPPPPLEGAAPAAGFGAAAGPAEPPPVEATPQAEPIQPPPLPERPPPVPPVPAKEAATVHASPSVRRFARELGVDLARVHGSGPKGRILRSDIQAFVKAELAAPSRAAPGAAVGLPPLPEIDFAQFGAIETRPLTRIQRLSAGNLHRNWVAIPHVTQFEEADITDLEAFRKEHGQSAQEQGFRLTLPAFLIKACVPALRKFPEFNASLHHDGKHLILKKYFHIGVAVDTPQGLVVPVIRDVDQKGVLELARELAELSARARERKLTPGEMQGGCFSISSLGGIGGTAFTPISNAPEVAILGVSRAVTKPVYRNGAFQPRLLLPLSLSYDHRVIDGALAARFIVYFSSVLADIRRILL